MKLESKHVFNMWDTNGRRKDYTNAYTIYLGILHDDFETDRFQWNSLRGGSSIGQYYFYKRAVESSPEIFKNTNKLFKFQKWLDKYNLMDSFLNGDYTTLKSAQDGVPMLSSLDKNIEARARHFTSNLVKIGFATEDRQITPAGNDYLSSNTHIDSLESLFPTKKRNLVLLRQIAKFRVYSRDSKVYFSPFFLLLSILLKHKRMNKSDLFSAISLIDPNFLLNNWSAYIDDLGNSTYSEIEDKYHTRMFQNISKKISYSDDKELPYESFKKIFKNNKSKQQIPTYYNFYKANRKFSIDHSQKSLDKLLNILDSPKNRAALNKAFNFGRSIYKINGKKSRTVAAFIDENLENQDLLRLGAKNRIYINRFKFAKRHDQIKEYRMSFERLVDATGAIRTINGITTLKQPKIWTSLNEYFDFEKNISFTMDSQMSKLHDNFISSDFGNNTSLLKILGLNSQKKDVLAKIQKSYNNADLNEIKKSILNESNHDFINFIKSEYKKERVISLLSLFENRNNDPIIQESIGTEADIPTIFEWLVGIAWFYISKETYDVFSSYNMSMTGDFLPDVHAGGGKGDIVIQYKNWTLLLEVTLMNKNAQKRGEWEPVLRHSVNLTVSEQKKQRDVYTYFIADTLDFNTINIWRAVAMVPLESTDTSDKSSGVFIFPFLTSNLCKWLDNSKVTEQSIKLSVKNSYSKLNSNFDRDWHQKLLTTIELL